MARTEIHREDLKALLRKRYGSLEAFQVRRGLTGQQVRDLLRGKSTAALAAVAAELNVDPDHLTITTGLVPSCGKGPSSHHGIAHRLSAVAK